MKRADDDADYPPEGGCLGFGAMHDLIGPRAKKEKHPIGFIHFPDKAEVKAVKRQKVKQKPKRRRAR